MPTSKRSQLKLKLSLSLCILALSGCVTIQNRTACAINGLISLGSTCAGTITGVTSQLTMDDTLDMLEARPERPDPGSPDKKLPPHPPGVFQSADDYNVETTEIEEMCRLLGSRCSYQVVVYIQNRKALSEQLKHYTMQ